jgi:hypothetical protein
VRLVYLASIYRLIVNFDIAALDDDRDKRPRMIVEGAVVVAAAELVQIDPETWNPEEYPADKQWIIVGTNNSSLHDLDASEFHLFLPLRNHRRFFIGLRRH